MALSDNLKAYWKMDEASWSGSAGEVIDSSGGGENGTASGNATTTATNALISRSGTFDGTGDWVTTDAVAGDIIGHDHCSYQIWFKAASGAFDAIKCMLSLNNLMNIQGGYPDPGNGRFVVNVGNAWKIAPLYTSARLDDANWHHVVGTYDGSYVRLYIDGTQVGTGTSQTGNIGPTGSTVTKIAAAMDNGIPFPGLLDEAAVWDRCITSTEVTTLWNSGSGKNILPVDTNDARDAKIHGQNSTNETRNAKIHGQLSTFETRSAKITGYYPTVTDERAAKIHGTTTVTDTRPAKIHGQSSAGEGRNAKVHGQLSTSEGRNAKIHGGIVSTGEKPAKIHGQSSTNDTKPAKIRGGLPVNESRNAKIHGQSSAAEGRSAKVHGTIITGEGRAAKIHGVSSTNDSRNAKIHGLINIGESKQAKVHGSVLTNDGRDSKIKGAVTVYTRESETSLKTDNSDLSTLYSSTDYTNVGTDNDVYVDLNMDKLYGTHHFTIRSNYQSLMPIIIVIKAKSGTAPSSSPVYLQIFNRTSGNWDAVSSEASAGVDEKFTLSGNVTSGLADYYDSNYVVGIRFYQEVA